jgi:hypothetical protein
MRKIQAALIRQPFYYLMLYSTIRAVVGGTLVSGPMVIVSPVITLVPASVQLLVENATKHNAVSSSRPLKIVISSDGRSLTVRNNLNPKFSIVQSTGIGQKYIRQQYLDACGKNIKIEKLTMNMQSCCP